MLGSSIHLLAADQKSSGGFSPIELILIVVVILGVYFLMIRPNNRRRQQQVQQQNSVRPGARVRTTAGMYATVVAVDDEAGDVVLEVAPGVESRFMKRAIMDVLSNGEEPEEAEAPLEDQAGDQVEDEAVEDETVSAEDESAEEEEPDTAPAEDGKPSQATAKSGGGQD